MGNGIAHVCALAGLDVQADRRRARGSSTRRTATIDSNMGRQVKRGLITEADETAALGRIRPAST